MTVQVPGNGPLDAKICFVGEAPGREEKEKGRPFVGSAGKKLTSLLIGAGINRDNCYLTNVVKERPPNNDIKTFIEFKSEGIKTVTNSYLDYEAQLHQELMGLSCNIIVPLGAVALYAVGRHFSIMKWRGSILESSSETGSRKMIPTIHPAAALRNSIFSYHIRRDLERIRIESASPLIQLPQRHLIVEPTFDEAMEYLATLPEEVGFDIEVSGYTMSCLSFSKSSTDCISIPFRGKLGNYWHEHQERALMLQIAEVLENPKIRKIIHNASFDTAFMYEEFGIQTKSFECTMIAHGMLWPAFPKSLAFLCSMFTREPYYKDEGKDSKAGLSTDFRRFWLYNAKDSAVAHESWIELKKRLHSYGIWDTYQLQRNTVSSLNYFQVRGLRLNSEATAAMYAKLTREIEHHNVELQIEVDATREKKNLPPLNLPDTFAGSPPQKKKYFYGDLKLPEILNKDGKVTTDLLAMRKLFQMGYREASILSQISKKTKLKNSYIGVEVDADSRLRGSWNPIGAHGGRFSCSKLWRGTFYGEKRYVGMNMQTLPDDFKIYVLADKGCYFIDIDLAQAENRIVAFVGNVPKMKRAFLEGIDLHSLTAAGIFHIPIEDVSREVGSSDLGDGTKSQRDWGKQVNHAFNYGLGPNQFATKFEISKIEAKEFRGSYFRTYPEVESRYQAKVRSDISKDRTLINPYGRKSAFLGFLNEDLYRAGYAFIPQSTVADKINSCATIPINQSEEFWALEALLQVHDSVLVQASFDTPIEDIMKQLTKLKTALEEPIPFDEPFVIPAEFKLGLSYGKMKKFDIENLAVELALLKEENENAQV